MSQETNQKPPKIRYVYISEAARILGISAVSLRRWEKQGKIVPDNTTMGGWRQYRLDVLDRLCKNGMRTNKATS